MKIDRTLPFLLCLRRPILCIASLLSLLVMSTPWDASASAESERAVAIGLAREGRCEPAIELLTVLQSAPPSDPEIARLLGECALRLQDFRLAISSLELARALDLDAPDVDLHLGMAYYHSGQIEKAQAALIRVGAVDGGRPEFLLYSGLVAFAQDDYAAAMGRLGAASQARDAPVEPMASFFLGRAAVGARDRDRARTAFQAVLESHPGTPWADEANRALAALDDAEEIPWWVSAEVGFEHDDNPLLRGTTVSLPGDIAGQSDQRAFWFVDLGATLFDLGDTSGGAMVRYGGSEHHELERFDTHAPGATLWLDRALGVGDASLRLQYDFDVAWIDASSIENDPFVVSHLVGASLYKPWSDGIYTLLATSVGVDDYRYERFDLPDEGTGVGLACSPGVSFCGPVLDEKRATDRDGVGVGASVLQHVPIPLESKLLTLPWIEGSYRYQHYSSEGSEYDHDRHQVALGFGAQLPFEIGLRMSGSYAYLPYDNPSVFPDPSDVAAATVPGGTGTQYFLDDNNREEHETRFRVSLERAFFDRFTLTTRYSRTRNRSNADVFSYTRDLFGISIRVVLGG